MTGDDDPLVDPLDDRLRWCVHCRADCWPDPAYQRHTDTCPTVTGLWPVTVDDIHPVWGLGCCCACGAPFALGEHYTLVDDSTGLPAAEPDTGWVVCAGCAVLGRDPRPVPR